LEKRESRDKVVYSERNATLLFVPVAEDDVGDAWSRMGIEQIPATMATTAKRSLISFLYK